MEPNDNQKIWEVMVDGDCIAHFRKQDKAVSFMMEYGDETWFCMARTLFFCDEVDPRKVYDNVTVEIEGEWVQYTESGPHYSEIPEGGADTAASTAQHGALDAKVDLGADV